MALLHSATSYVAVSYLAQSSTYLGVAGRSLRKCPPWGTDDANLSPNHMLPRLASHTFCLNDKAFLFGPFLTLMQVCVGLNPQGIDQESFTQIGVAQNVKAHGQSCARAALPGRTHAHASLTGSGDVQVVRGRGQ